MLCDENKMIKSKCSQRARNRANVPRHQHLFLITIQLALVFNIKLQIICFFRLVSARLVEEIRTFSLGLCLTNDCER